MEKKTLVIGVGNLIQRDEGVGVHAVRKLTMEDLPPWVEAIDGGTDILPLLSEIQEAERIIFIDALKAGGIPGTIYRVVPEDLINESKRALSLHEVSLLDILIMAKHLGGHGDVIIIGVEPKEIGWGMELTPEVEAVLPRIIKAVLKELKGSQ